jgi:hypothetical protein
MGNSLALAVGLGVGFSQFALFFSDLSRNETARLRLFEAVVLSGVGGFLVAFLATRNWPLFCVVASWGSVLSSLMLAAMGEGFVASSRALPSLVAILLGGVIGALSRSLLSRSGTGPCGPPAA